VSDGTDGPIVEKIRKTAQESETVQSAPEAEKAGE
jgi:hypothetical protein